MLHAKSGRKISGKMFTLFSIFLIGFVLVNAFAPNWMETVLLFGFNLAVIYGFSLVFFAVILGIVFTPICD